MDDRLLSMVGGAFVSEVAALAALVMTSVRLFDLNERSLADDEYDHYEKTLASR